MPPIKRTENKLRISEEGMKPDLRKMATLGQCFLWTKQLSGPSNSKRHSVIMVAEDARDDLGVFHLVCISSTHGENIGRRWGIDILKNATDIPDLTPIRKIEVEIEL